MFLFNVPFRHFHKLRTFYGLKGSAGFISLRPRFVLFLAAQFSRRPFSWQCRWVQSVFNCNDLGFTSLLNLLLASGCQIDTELSKELIFQTFIDNISNWRIHKGSLRSYVKNEWNLTLTKELQVITRQWENHWNKILTFNLISQLSFRFKTTETF